MFWRKKWLDELPDGEESPFFECRHLLFKEEAGYPICPSCGGLIKENFPKKNTDKARLHLLWKKVQQLWSVKFGEGYSLWLVLFPAIFVPEYLGYWLLSTGDYGFTSFFLPSRHRPTMISYAIDGYFVLFFFFLGQERTKRFATFSLGFERFHRILYSWPVRVVLFAVIIFLLNLYMPKIYEPYAQYYISKHDYLTPAQHAKGVELFIQTNMISIWMTAGLLAIHELIDRRRTKWLKEANEAYLSGGC